MLTSWESSLRIALPITPVVAVLKSIWEAPRVRALKESGRRRVAICFVGGAVLGDFFSGGSGGGDGGG